MEIPATNWPQLAQMVLKKTIESQGQDGMSDLFEAFKDEWPQYTAMGNILANDGFIRRLEIVADGTFPCRITIKGLALYSVLHWFSVSEKGSEEWEPTAMGTLRTRNAHQLLAALVGQSE